MIGMDPDERRATSKAPAVLLQLTKQHQVCWEVWPLHHVDPTTGMRAVGYQLELLGTHNEPRHTPGPGCDECVRVYDALRQIAAWIMPKQERESVYRVGVFDHSMRFSPRRDFRKDVELVVTIQHRGELTDPVDECEIRCLQEMEQSLRALGARKHHW
jgi:hypothetical protein